jgi:predicted TIM-barrel enzyme
MPFIADYCWYSFSMKRFLLTGNPHSTSADGTVIYCPALAGLSGSQADLAIVMPRIDTNRALIVERDPEFEGYAGVLTCDPFGTAASFLSRLADHGYQGVANWPSTIFFEGQTKHSMASIPATPELEYAWLANAQKSGFQTLAFFRSLEQGRAALNTGLRQLVLHPGLITQDERGPVELLTASLRELTDSLHRQAMDTEIFFYDHESLSGSIRAEDIGVEGVNTNGASA